MFCHKCGTELPEDSQFCRKCGVTLPTSAASTVTTSASPTAPAAVPAPAPIQPPQQGRLDRVLPRIALWALIPLFIIALFWWSTSTTTKGTGSPLQQLTAKQYTLTLPQKIFAVKALSSDSVKFEVPTGAFDVRAEGSFSVTGGSGNDVEAFIFNEDNFANWQNRHSATSYYNSGRVTRDTINVSLPGPGTYFMVFSNKFSLLTDKVVQADVTLRYSQ